MRLFRPPVFIRWLYPDAIFRVKTTEKILYLTFDDGPDPVSTPLLLGILDSFNIKAVFFCTGMSAEKYPDLIVKIKDGGHIIGNHGYNHYDGWKTPVRIYCEDVNNASDKTSLKIFRPPYGRLGIKQFLLLRRSYTIFFWDLMAYDFDTEYGAQKSMETLVSMMRPGSVIVLHDTHGSTSRVFLREFLDQAKNKKFRFGLPEFR